MNWQEDLPLMGAACAIFLVAMLILSSIKSSNNAVLPNTIPTRHSCEFVLKRMPTTADSVDAITLLDECMYARDSLLPLVRGDALRDLPEQR